MVRNYEGGGELIIRFLLFNKALLYLSVVFRKDAALRYESGRFLWGSCLNHPSHSRQMGVWADTTSVTEASLQDVTTPPFLCALNPLGVASLVAKGS